MLKPSFLLFPFYYFLCSKKPEGAGEEEEEAAGQEEGEEAEEEEVKVKHGGVTLTFNLRCDVISLTAVCLCRWTSMKTPSTRRKRRCLKEKTVSWLLYQT